MKYKARLKKEISAYYTLFDTNGLSNEFILEKVLQNIISFSKKEQKIILPNTNSQYGHSDNEITEESPFKPLSIYAETKCSAENDLLNSGNGIALRLATVFGVSPRMRLDLLVNDFTYKAFTDGYLVLFESNFKRNYIHVLDIARPFRFIIENYEFCNNNAFNVGLSDSNLSKKELALKIKKYVPNLVIKEEEFRKDVDQRNYIVSNKKLESSPRNLRGFNMKLMFFSF
jgi:nucleoside-diphosphate-sugar epimerase